jgi:tetratricopeptide (TPR) repeat protein
MDVRNGLIAACLGGLAASCAARIPPPTSDVGITNLQTSSPVEVEKPSYRSPLAPEHVRLPTKSPEVDPRTTQAVDALVARDYAKVLELTESSTSPWLDSDRGAALAGLDRTDEAVEAFKRAELRFSERHDTVGRSSAVWGRAHALDEAGRCDEARRAYQDFERLMRETDPHAAEKAAAYAGSCRPRAVLR